MSDRGMVNLDTVQSELEQALKIIKSAHRTLSLAKGVDEKWIDIGLFDCEKGILELKNSYKDIFNVPLN